mmetsp:Transcript_13098/g.31974  ORF Transcript_13098/g.31974 Transcript_13098/m.31974 type:complete len:104 (+) Transcript_13098:83-394(+)
MGKKSRKIRDKKKEWTKLNRGEDAYNEAMSKLGHGYGLLQYKSPSVDCVHGDVMNDPQIKKWRPADRQRWFQQATNIATFGQMYLSKASILPDLTAFSVAWIA